MSGVHLADRGQFRNCRVEKGVRLTRQQVPAELRAWGAMTGFRRGREVRQDRVPRPLQSFVIKELFAQAVWKFPS